MARKNNWRQMEMHLSEPSHARFPYFVKIQIIYFCDTAEIDLTLLP